MDVYYCSCFRRYVTVHVFFEEILIERTLNTRLVSVLVGFLFDMQISLILKIQSISI